MSFSAVGFRPPVRPHKFHFRHFDILTRKQPPAGGCFYHISISTTPYTTLAAVP